MSGLAFHVQRGPGKTAKVLKVSFMTDSIGCCWVSCFSVLLMKQINR